MGETLGFTVVLVTLIVAGVAVLLMAMHNRRGLREMQHRERLAMIERGLMPPPETNPEAFERQAGLSAAPPSHSILRLRSAGVMMIGFGFALMTLLTFVAESARIGVGVGGAFALIGAAFFVNAAMSMQHQPPSTPPADRAGRPTPRPSEPPLPPAGLNS